MVDRDQIKKWWNRTWSNWEDNGTLDVHHGLKNDPTQNPLKTFLIQKRTSNDGMIQMRRVKR